MMRKLAICALMAMLIMLAVTGIAYAGKPPPPTGPGEYIVVPVAEGGMKCMLKKDYSEFCIMPPGYTMRAQVFKRGTNNGVYAVVTSGVTVTYRIENNTYSQNGAVPKTNFWTYAADLGWTLTMDKGTTGSGLSGTMVLNAEGNAFEAKKVPQTGYLDGTSTTRTPYQNGVITVKDSSGNLLCEQKFVMPASDESMCSDCHGGTGGADTDRAIVQKHDTLHGTTMATDGKANACANSSCHKDPSIGRTTGPASYLSTAMHSFHASKMPSRPAYKPVCYYCHPGPTAKCNRGAMFVKNKACDNSGCHGSMATVGSTSRTPWSAAGLPRCDNCHSAIYAENAGKKFADSMLTNSPDPTMNNKMWCQTCHGAQHAEWPSSLAADNQVPVALQGTSDPLGRTGLACKVCHDRAFTGSVHR
ncbi:MAG: hypothetical protein QME41_09370 [Actinomycetota bacterium]|nr:hypothetical protein [Actinomycetota bacterium]